MRRGFTLTELLVAIAILGLIVLGVMTLLMTGNESYLTGSNQAEAQAAARAALERMTQDIREAGYGPTTDQNCVPPTPAAGCFNAITGAGGVGGPTATTFTLQTDWNGSGVIDGGVAVNVNYVFGGVDTNVQRGERVTYSVIGNALCRQESAIAVAPPDPVCPAGSVALVTSIQQASAGGVLQPFFQYLDANGQVIANPGATPEQIRTIWVQMRVGVQNQPPAIWMAGAVSVTMSDRIRLRNRI